MVFSRCFRSFSKHLHSGKNIFNPMFPFRQCGGGGGVYSTVDSIVWIMEARKPDRQGKLSVLLANLLPCFISYCHVIARMELLVFVCAYSWYVGRARENGGGHIGQFQSFMHRLNVMASGG